MNKDLLSVIVPMYNVKNYIEDCLNSIMVQTYKNIEIIVIDDGSTDGSTELCQRYLETDDRIIYYKQKNRGVINARLKGVELSKAAYVAFVDADDYIEPNMFEILMENIKQYDIVCCGLIYWKRNLQVFNDMKRNHQSLKEMEVVWSKMICDFEKQKYNTLLPSMNAKIFKRDLALNILENMNKDIVYGEDAVFVYRYVLECKSAYFLKKALYHYRYRENSVVHSKNDKMLENINKIYKELKTVFDKHYMKDVLIKQLEKWIVRLTMDAVNKYMGFSKESRIIRFLVNVDEYIYKRIVIYGAGEMGKDVEFLLQKSGIQKIAWVDKEYKLYQKQGWAVETVDILKTIEFDVILISVSQENIADCIKKDLIDMGIPEEKIIWKKPIVLI